MPHTVDDLVLQITIQSHKSGREPTHANDQMIIAFRILLRLDQILYGRNVSLKDLSALRKEGHHQGTLRTLIS